MKHSLYLRLLVSASLILLICLGAIGFSINKAFVKTQQQVLDKRLQSSVYTLLAVTSFVDGQLQVSDWLLDPKLDTPDSGSYAQIIGINQDFIWKSGFLSQVLPIKQPLATGEKRFQLDQINGKSFYSFMMTVAWDDEDGKEHQYVVQAIEDLASYHQHLVQFQHRIIVWLVSLGLALLLIQAAVLYWGLLPIRQVAEQVRQIEHGKQANLSGYYPPELSILTNGINKMIASQHRQLERYRNSLGDLAHSLKTPLAILRGLDPNPELQTQVDRMADIVNYQLQRAATAGQSVLPEAIYLSPLIQKITSALGKVYRDKRIKLTLNIKTNSFFYGDKDDIMELLGNLLDNAFKWCQSQVAVDITVISEQLQICISDDGAGIPKEKIEAVLIRGGRADEHISGHGIGLAMVKYIVESYQGRLDITQSDWGGAKICVNLTGGVD